MLHICCPPLHCTYCPPIRLPPKGTKPVPSIAPGAHTHTQVSSIRERDATAAAAMAFVRSGEGAADGRTERERGRERGRERERKKSIIHGSRKISATLSLSARPLHSMCWNAEGRKQGQREAEASCRRWNCSLWQRWVVCSNILRVHGHSAP